MTKDYIGLLTPLPGVCFPNEHQVSNLKSLKCEPHCEFLLDLRLSRVGVEQMMEGESDCPGPSWLISRLETEDLGPFVSWLPLSSLMSPHLGDLAWKLSLKHNKKCFSRKPTWGSGRPAKPRLLVEQRECGVFSYVGLGCGSGTVTSESWVPLHNKGRENCSGGVDKKVAKGTVREI